MYITYIFMCILYRIDIQSNANVNHYEILYIYKLYDRHVIID